MRFIAITLLLLSAVAGTLGAQDTIPAERYARALSFLGAQTQNRKLFNAYVDVSWLPEGSGGWYVDHSPAEKAFLRFGPDGADIRPLFDHERLAVALEGAVYRKVNEADLPLERVRFRGPDTLAFRAYDQDWTWQDDRLLTADGEDPGPGEAYSSAPDGSWQAYAEDNNLYLRRPDGTDIRPLTTDGRPNFEYASWYGWDDILEGENAARPAHFGVNWSPDGQWLLANRVDLRSASKMFLLDWSVDTLFRPRLLSYYRGSPGDTGMVYVEPVFFHVESGTRVPVSLPRATHINTVNVRWLDTPGRVYLEWQPRGFQSAVLATLDLSTGVIDTLYSERSRTNIDNFRTEIAEESDRVFFLSEKSGWRQLYSVNLSDRREQRLTRGAYYVNDIVRVDERERTVYFTASGREGAANPYDQQLYRVGFDGGEPEALTPEPGNHRINFDPAGRHFVDNLSTVRTPTRTLLRDGRTGRVIAELAHASTEGLEGWAPPDTFTALAGDGATTIFGAVWKPTDFDPDQRYPVLDASYTGPHTHVFPTDYAAALSLQSFAELGFVVVRIDGRGSSHRSKAFHDFSYKNLGGNLGDHVAAIRQLGRRYAWVDTTRVGIFGHSAGGYDAGHAVLAYPEFYKVAVASSADHDHRMEKAWWPEMYMGWPVDSAYHLQSNITLAGNLRGKLLITHGGIDENVNPSATFKLAEALIRADKPFDMLILPGQRHGYTGAASRYFTKLRWNYFIEHLLGLEPRWNVDWPAD